MTDIQIQAGVGGLFQLTKRKAPPEGVPYSASDEITYEGPWFSNMVVDSGLNTMGYGTNNNVPYLVAKVGTGNTAPAGTQTSLTSVMRQISNPTADAYAFRVNGGSGLDTSDPNKPFWWIKAVYTFGAGSIAGNVSEVGTFFDSGNGATMFSRELVRDLSGNPTTVTVLADEYLEVRYEFRVYPSIVPDVRTVNLLGVDYTVTTIPVMIAPVGGDYLGIPMLFSGYANEPGNSVILNSPAASLGGIFVDVPVQTGTNYAISPVTPGIGLGSVAYVAGSRERKFVLSAAPSQANLPGGLGICKISTGLGTWKTSFSPNIPKNSGRSFSNVLTVSWARYSP